MTYSDPTIYECEPCLVGTYNNIDMFFLGCGTGYYSIYPDPTSCECEPCPVGTYNNRDMFYFQDVVLVTTVPTQIQPAVSVNNAL